MEWKGPVEDALARLALVEDDAHIEGFWRALDPEKADRFYRERDAEIAIDNRLKAELERVGAVGAFFGGGAEAYLGNPYREDSEAYDRGSCYVYQKILSELDPDLPSAETTMVEQWSGSPDEAFKPLARLPDDAGLIAFCRLFNPGVAEEPRIALEEARRVEDRALEHEVERLRVRPVGVALSNARRIDFRSSLGTPGQPLAWTAYDRTMGTNEAGEVRPSVDGKRHRCPAAHEGPARQQQHRRSVAGARNLGEGRLDKTSGGIPKHWPRRALLRAESRWLCDQHW
jgi:hypothetical protein